MEAYELHRGNYVTYNSESVKFVSFVDDKCKRCVVEYPNGKRKTVWVSRLMFIECDDEFLLNNGFHRDRLEQYADTIFYYKTSVFKEGFSIMYDRSYDTVIEITNVRGTSIRSVGDFSVNHLQNILTLCGNVDIANGFKVKRTYTMFDDSEWVSF